MVCILLKCRAFTRSNSKGSWQFRVSRRPRPIMLKILPIMLLSNAQNSTHYAQYYAHESWKYATINWHKNNLTY